MASKRETGGVVLAVAGFGALVLAIKGTWGAVWHDLFHGPSVNAASSAGGLNPPNTPGGTPSSPGVAAEQHHTLTHTATPKTPPVFQGGQITLAPLFPNPVPGAGGRLTIPSPSSWRYPG